MKRLVAAALLAVCLGSTLARAEDCVACKPGKVCAAHEGADDAAIKEASSLLKDKDLEKRRSGIDRLAVAAWKHLNARSKKITGEIMKMLTDPEATVKGYAAEKLGAVGDEPTAAQALAAEAGKQEKALPNDKPSKDTDVPKWEESMRSLESIYRGLGKLTTQPAAAAAFDHGIRSTCPWVCRVAAENCKGFKKNKLIVKALVDMLAKFFAQNVSEGNSAAWTAISMALPEVSGCNDIATQKDGPDAARWNAEWQKWFRANEKTMK